MKRICFYLIFLCLSVTAFTQTRGQHILPPKTVSANFNSYYPSADEVYWNSARNGYVASFLQKGYWMKALFTDEGEWLFTDVDVPQADFPKPALAHFNSRYKSYRITNASYHDALSGRYYRLMVRGNAGNLELRYDDNGNFIKAINK